MSDQEGGRQASASLGAPQTAAAQAGVTVLDQSLWTQFNRAKSPEDFIRAWLGLQCRNIPGAFAAVVALGEPEVGPFSPVSVWPQETALTELMQHATEEAVEKRQPVVLSAKSEQDSGTISLPITVEDQIFGAVSVSLGKPGLSAVEALRQLQWGIGWLESLLRREQSASDAALHSRTLKALDVVAVILDQKSFKQSSAALVTELAERLHCDQVAIGFKRRNRVRVDAISHVSRFDRRMNLVRDFGLAMEEAIDQSDIILHPLPESWDFRVTRIHEDLAVQHRAGAVLTIPIRTGDEFVGALLFERPQGEGFDAETVELCDVIASMVGQILMEKRKNDRWILTKILATLWHQIVALLGPRYIGRKIATIVAAVLVYFGATTYSQFEVVAPAKLEGSVQRLIVAPFDGYIQSETARAGQTVDAGEVLATLNDRDLTLERLRWVTARKQRQLEFDRALAENERAQVNIIRSQIDQANAQIDLLDEQLARTIITAPIGGIIVAGDLSQSVGSAVERGRDLFTIAPLDDYRVVLEVEEGDISEIEAGLSGQLRLSTSPDQAFPIDITQITPIANQRDGRNFFRVEAKLGQNEDWFRPNMNGVARVSVEERLLVANWTRRLTNWFKLAIWRLVP